MKVDEQLPDAGQAERVVPATGQAVPALSSAVMRIPVSVQIVIGTAQLPIAQVTQLAPGAVLALDEKLGTPARMLVNGREVAKGNLLVIDETEGRLGLHLTEIVDQEEEE